MKGLTTKMRMIGLLLLPCLVLIWACEQEPYETEEAMPGEGAVMEEARETAGPLPEIPMPRTPEPVEIPAAPKPGSNQIFAYFKIHEPQTLVDEFDAWAHALNPQSAPGDFRAQVETQYGDLSAFGAGDNVIVAVVQDPMSPMMGTGMGLGGLMPVGPDTEFAQNVSRMTGGTMAAVEDGVAFASAPSTLDKVTTLSENMQALMNAAMPTDMQLLLNTDALMQMFGPMIQNFVGMMQGMMMQNLQQQGQMSAQEAQRTMKILQAEIQMMLDFLNQVDAMTINANLEEEEAELSFVVAPKSGTAVADYFDSEMIAAPDLTVYLEEDQVMRGQMAIRNMEKWVQFNKKFMDELAMTTDTAVLEEIDQLMSRWAETGRWDYAFGLDLAGDPVKFTYEGVAIVENFETARGLLDEYMSALSEGGAIKKYYEAMGIRMDVQGEPQTEDFHGYTLKKYMINFQPMGAMGAEQTEEWNQMFGQMQFETLFMDPVVLFTLNKPVAAMGEAVLAGDLNEPAQAMMAYNPGGHVYFDIDVTQFMRFMLTQSGQPIPPNMPEDADPIMLAGFHQQGNGFYRMRIPQSLIQGMSPRVVEPIPQQPMQAPMEQMQEPEATTPAPGQ